MKLAIIIAAAVVAAAVVFEVVLRIIARRERKRFESMSPAEQRKHQEKMYKSQAHANS